MKKKLLFSIVAFVMCCTMLLTIGSLRPTPKLAKEMAKAEEVIEYEYQEEATDETSEESSEEIKNETTNDEVAEQEESDNDDEKCETCVCVFGKATLTLSPDSATITACIEKFNEDINLSKNENMVIFNDITAELKAQGISEDKITLDYFSAHPSYDFSAGYQPIGYYSKSCFSFEIDNLDNINSYINILTEKGVTDICNINYSLSNMEEEYTNALSQALENAKAKASKLLGSEDFNICKIREEAVFCSSNLCRQYIENAPSFTGKVEVEARVLVEFEIDD